MSIAAIFDLSAVEAEKKRNLEALAEMQGRIAVCYGLTIDELTEALKSAVEKKRLRTTMAELAAMQRKGIRTS